VACQAHIAVCWARQGGWRGTSGTRTPHTSLKVQSIVSSYQPASHTGARTNAQNLHLRTLCQLCALFHPHSRAIEPSKPPALQVNTCAWFPCVPSSHSPCPYEQSLCIRRHTSWGIERQPPLYCFKYNGRPVASGRGRRGLLLLLQLLLLARARLRAARGVGRSD